MPTEEFSRSVTVAATAAQVFAHLERPDNYVGLAPLVVAVRDVATLPEEVRYVAVERFRLGPLRWDNPIRVSMTFPRAGRQVVSEVHSPGGVRLTATVELTDTPEGARVRETIRVVFPRPLRPLVIGQATKAQRHRLAELARRMSETHPR
ncbi:SRPBCC family protein [Streptomyces sp. HUAS MG91]|uniref:SRPBCC family protein n=1 Tax=Streptomyces tabacisoli TaxID=3156398 RepID=A0AAU8J229_9ACTN